MREDKSYEFKYRYLIFDTVACIVLGFGFLFFLAFSIIQLNPLIVVIGVIPGYMAFLSAYTVKITRQFNKYDKDKRIIISEDRNVLTFIWNEQSTSIQNSDVEKVEIYEQKYLGKFGNYWYIVICTTDDRRFLMTKFTVPMLVYDKALEKFLSKKRRVQFKKRVNFIDEAKFLSPQD